MSDQRPPGDRAPDRGGAARTTVPPTPAGSSAADPTPEAPPRPSSAVERANRLSAANMARSLLPLVVLVLLLVGYLSLRHPDDPVHTVDPSTTVQLARARADYAVPVPTGLPGGYRPTYARTNAGEVTTTGQPVTVEIGYVAPGGGFAGFVVSDDQRAQPLRSVLDGARPEGAATIGGQQWQRLHTARGETALTRQFPGDATVTVTGSATDDELSAVAAAVQPAA